MFVHLEHTRYVKFKPLVGSFAAELPLHVRAWQ